MAELLTAGKNRSNQNHKHQERRSFFFKDDEDLAQKEQKKEELSTSDVGVEIEVVEMEK